MMRVSINGNAIFEFWNVLEKDIAFITDTSISIHRVFKIGTDTMTICDLLEFKCPIQVKFEDSLGELRSDRR